MPKTTNSNCYKTQIKKHFCLPFNQFLKLQNLKSINRIFVFTSLFYLNHFDDELKCLGED